MRFVKYKCSQRGIFTYSPDSLMRCGGAVASRLVRSFPDRVVRVRALAGDIVLCSWARHLTLTVPLTTQEYKWVPANCWGNLTNCGEVTCDRLASRPGGVEILLATSCYRNRISSSRCEPVWLQGFTLCVAAYLHETQDICLIVLRLCLWGLRGLWDFF